MDIIDRTEMRRLVESGSARLVLTLGPAAYDKAHIPGSETYPDLDSALAALPRDEEIVVYCSGAACASSRQAQRALRHRGHRRVRRYAGGLDDWDRAGLPLVTAA